MHAHAWCSALSTPACCKLAGLKLQGALSCLVGTGHVLFSVWRACPSPRPRCMCMCTCMQVGAFYHAVGYDALLLCQVCNYTLTKAVGGPAATQKFPRAGGVQDSILSMLEGLVIAHGFRVVSGEARIACTAFMHAPACQCRAYGLLN